MKTDEEQHDYYERVAIMHFDGGLSLERAQIAAAIDVQQQKNLFSKELDG